MQNQHFVQSILIRCYVTFRQRGKKGMGIIDVAPTVPAENNLSGIRSSAANFHKQAFYRHPSVCWKVECSCEISPFVCFYLKG